MLVNGRISSRSYPRYRLARPFFRRVLRHVDRFCMQSEESARRIVDIGAERERVVVTGSLKFDSLEMPGHPPSGDRGRNRVLRYFRIAAGPAGDHRRQHAARAKRSRCSRRSSASARR